MPLNNCANWTENCPHTHTCECQSFAVLLFADKNCTFKANLLLGKIYVQYLGVEYDNPIEYIYSYYDVPTVIKHLDYS